jgi:hypothetical protein
MKRREFITLLGGMLEATASWIYERASSLDVIAS